MCGGDRQRNSTWYFETVLPAPQRTSTSCRCWGIGIACSDVVARPRWPTLSGMSRNTVIRATSEVEEGVEPSDRLRADGGGDKPAIDKQPGLLSALDELVHPLDAGQPDVAGAAGRRSPPMSWPTSWCVRVTPSQRSWCDACLHQLGYSLQAPSKQKEGTQQPRSRRPVQLPRRDCVRTFTQRRATRHQRAIPRKRSWSASSPTEAPNGTRMARADPDQDP